MFARLLFITQNLAALAPQEGGPVALKVISIMFPTIPQPKLRPRFAIVHGHVETYTPAKTKVFEAYVAAYYKKMTEGYKFDQGTPLAVTILFAMPVPSSKTKKTKKDMIDGRIQHTVKPDLDNLSKALLDALNGVAWHDDSQIVQLNVQKIYSEQPHIFLSIHEYV